MKIEVTTAAWLTETRQESFAAALRSGDPEYLVNSMAFSSLDMSDHWTRIGEATITVDIQDEEIIKRGMVKTLQAERKRVLADAQVKVNAINAKIQNLLAIEHTPEAAE